MAEHLLRLSREGHHGAGATVLEARKGLIRVFIRPALRGGEIASGVGSNLCARSPSLTGVPCTIQNATAVDGREAENMWVA